MDDHDRIRRGKVRDIFEVGDRLLIVATDRISAFDHVLGSGIPDKGRVLNQISLFWFKKFEPLVPNHILTADIQKMGFDKDFVDEDIVLYERP